MNRINIKILNAMEEKGVSYGELSKKTGIPKSALHRYASGSTKSVPADRLRSIAKALNISVEYLLVDDDYLETEDAEFLKSIGYLMEKVEVSPELDAINTLIYDKGWQINKFENGSYGVMAEEACSLDEEHIAALVSYVKGFVQSAVYIYINDSSGLMLPKLKSDADWMLKECELRPRVFPAKVKEDASDRSSIG